MLQAKVWLNTSCDKQLCFDSNRFGKSSQFAFYLFVLNQSLDRGWNSFNELNSTSLLKQAN